MFPVHPAYRAIPPGPQRDPDLRITPGPVAVRRAPKPHGRAGPPLADLVNTLQHTHHIAPNRGPHPAFLRTSCSTISSRLGSATSRFSSVFQPKRDAFAADLLQLLQPADLHRAHSGKLLLTPVEHRLGDAGLAANLLHRRAAVGLPQNKGNLLIRIPLPLHGTTPSSRVQSARKSRIPTGPAPGVKPGPPAATKLPRSPAWSFPGRNHLHLAAPTGLGCGSAQQQPRAVNRSSLD